MKTETDQPLHQQMRFPRDIWDAEVLPKGKIAIEGTQPAAAGNFWCGLGGDRHAIETLRKTSALIQSQPLAFSAASNAIRPEGWRLLYVCGTAFALETILVPRFSPGNALRDLCDLEKCHGSPPPHLLGSERSGEGIANETAVAIRELSESESAAAWAILCAAHALNLNETEIVSYEWWTPSWLLLIAERICADNAQ